MPTVEEKKEQVSVRLRPKLLERARRIAKKKGMDYTEFHRLAIQRLVEAEERKGS